MEVAVRGTRRLGGVDAARAVAVLGMVMVHFGPTPAPDTVLGDVFGVTYGRASVLFALLAGVGVALLAARGPDGSARRPAGVRGRLLLRAALLLPLGLWLQGLDHGVLVILQFYALYFVFAALVFTLPDLLLLVGAVSSLLGGAMVYLAAEMAVPGWFAAYPATIGDPPGRITRELLLSGSYPLATWAAPLLVGLWVGRRDLSSPATLWWLLGAGLAVAGAAAFAAGPDGAPGLAGLLTAEPHGQMPLWMLGSIGSGCAVLGGALLLVGRLPRLMWPLVATGQMALTVYVGHLLLLHADAGLVRRESVPEAFLTVGIFFLTVVCVCAVWRSLLPRGPLEAALGAPWWVVERVRGYLGPGRKVRREPAARGEGGGTGP